MNFKYFPFFLCLSLDAESDDGVPQRRKTDKKGSLKDRGVISSKRNAQSYTSSDDIDKMKVSGIHT